MRVVVLPRDPIFFCAALDRRACLLVATMANPRQRRKARSGKWSGATKSAKRSQQRRLKRAPTVMGPEVLRENWDPKLTVRQKYVTAPLISQLCQTRTGTHARISVGWSRSE